MSKSVLKKVVIIVVILIIGIILATVFRPKAKLTQAININTMGQPTLGSANAPVHIVAFEDLKCIACKDFNMQLFPKIKKKYIDTGTASYTVMTLAFIPGSTLAGNAALCLNKLDPNSFFAFLEYVYQHQPPETENWATIPKLMEFATQVPAIDQKINQDQLSQCIFDGPYNRVLKNNYNEARRIMGETVTTPSIYVNGIKVDPLTLKQFEKLIDEQKIMISHR